MGCDIHMTIECKIDNAWHCVWGGQIRPRVYIADAKDNDYQSMKCRTRDYDFFGRLAGVRRDGPKPRGIPADVSIVTRHVIDGWDYDGHSHSWANLGEFCDLWAEGRLTTEQAIEALFDVYSDEKPENLRVVYWFDN